MAPGPGFFQSQKGARTFLSALSLRRVRKPALPEKWGHPLAGRSSRHRRSREINFFISLRSTRWLRDLLVTRPCFLFMRCLPVPGRQVGPVRTSLSLRLISLWLNRHQDQGIGAILMQESSAAPGKSTCPRKLPACARQTGRYHALSNGSGFTDPVALLLRSPTP